MLLDDDLADGDEPTDGSVPGDHGDNDHDGGDPGSAGDNGDAEDGDFGSDSDPGDTDPGTPTTTHPSSILVNGDFETGLMCWGNWVWSQAGMWKGNYRFNLSPEAHSGSWSAEIACEGSDCLKAALFSLPISTPPGQSHVLSLWAQCAQGTDSIMSLESSGGEVTKPISCNGTWTQNRLSYTPPAGASTFRAYVYNRSRNPLRIDDVVLTYSDGSVPTQTFRHGGSRDARVVNKVMQVDGAPFLAVGFFDVPYDDLARAAAVGVNVVTGISTETADCLNTARGSYLDRAYDLGINVLPDSTTTARTGVPSVFPSIIRQYAPHKANIGWFLVDEPDQSNVFWFYIDPNVLIAEHDAIAAVTSLPVMVDYQRADWKPADVDPYNGSSDIWMAEPYGSDFNGLTKAATAFQSLAPAPMWFAQDDIAANLIVPKQYWVIIKGGTGILYFAWPSFRDNAPLLAAVQQGFDELKSLKDVIFAAPASTPVGATGGIGFTTRVHGGERYILAVNPVATTVSTTFTVSGLTSGSLVTVLFENRTITSQAGSFTDTFAGVARHVYRLP